LQQLAEWIRLAAPNLQESSGRVEAGKHLGQDLGEVADKDPAYCQWILRAAEEPESSDEIQAMASWLKEKAPHVEEHAPLVGGRRHFGRPISELVHEDPVFCQWILRRAKEADAGEGVREMAGWLEEHAPHLKEMGALASGRKHRGRPMSEVAQEDPAYCQWVLRQAKEGEPSSDLREMARWLTKNVPHLKDEKLAHASGRKHCGRLLSEVVAEDPAYCQWILRQAEDGNASEVIRDAARWLKENAPHLKDVAVAAGTQHYGRSLADLVVEDPSYCQWVLKAAQEPGASKRLEANAGWLSENAPHLKEVPVVRLHGIHRGVPLPQIVAEDPLWCLWVMEQPKAFCKQFGEISEWFGKHAPELLATSKADGPAFERISEKFFQMYGRIFVVRRGKHRMKTFSRVQEEAPQYIDQIEKRLKSKQETDRTGHLYKNDCFLVVFAEQQRTQEQSATASGSSEASRDSAMP